MVSLSDVYRICQARALRSPVTISPPGFQGRDIAGDAAAWNRGARNFSEREQRLLHFFHHELGRLIGTSLASVFDPDPLQLPRRERETLACLLEGDSEKQVAAPLGVCSLTAHQYVKSL